MEKTYREHRGFHYVRCQRCRNVRRERIPDQAYREVETVVKEGEVWTRWMDGYRDNPGNPVLGLCPGCDHNVGLGGISLGPSSETWDRDGGADPIPFHLSKHIRDLPEHWRPWARIAYQFARDEDTASHVIIKLAEMAKRSPNPEGPPKSTIYRVARWETIKYSRREGRRRHDSLYQRVESIDGDDGLELQETIADDRAPDLDSWIDARTKIERLPPLPQRLICIVGKKMNKERLSATEWSYLYDWRRRLREGLPTEVPQKAATCRCPRCGRILGRSMSSAENIQEYYRYQNLARGWLRRHTKGCKGGGSPV